MGQMVVIVAADLTNRRNKKKALNNISHSAAILPMETMGEIDESKACATLRLEPIPEIASCERSIINYAKYVVQYRISRRL